MKEIEIREAGRQIVADTLGVSVDECTEDRDGGGSPRYTGEKDAGQMRRPKSNHQKPCHVRTALLAGCHLPYRRSARHDMHDDRAGGLLQIHGKGKT